LRAIIGRKRPSYCMVSAQWKIHWRIRSTPPAPLRPASVRRQGAARRPKRLQGAWTPPVEDCNTREIGLQQTGGEENLPFYLQILTDDINEKTPYRVTLFSWREYARQKTRLKLAKKTSDLDGVVRQIQWLGLQHGQLLQEERVRATLKALLQD